VYIAHLATPCCGSCGTVPKQSQLSSIEQFKYELFKADCSILCTEMNIIRFVKIKVQHFIV